MWTIFRPTAKKSITRGLLGRDEVWAVPALGGTPRRVASANYVVPSPDGAFIYFTRTFLSRIFRAEKSGLNEELVYNFEDTGLPSSPPSASAISRRQRPARRWCASGLARISVFSE